MKLIIIFLIGFFFGIFLRLMVKRIGEILYTKSCRSPFSLCLDCNLHNRYKRYHKHLQIDQQWHNLPWL